MKSWVHVGTFNGQQLFIGTNFTDKVTFEEAQQLVSEPINGLVGRLPTIDECRYISESSIAYQTINGKGIHYWSSTSNNSLIQTYHLIKRFLITSPDFKISAFPVLLV